MQPVMLIDIVFSKSSLDLALDFIHNIEEVIIILHLQFLMVTATLIWGSPFYNFTQPIKYLRRSSGFFSQEILLVLYHELQVSFVLSRTPSSTTDMFLVHLQAKLFYLLISWLKTLLFRLFL
jgi:hypothetical protein